MWCVGERVARFNGDDMPEENNMRSFNGKVRSCVEVISKGTTYSRHLVRCADGHAKTRELAVVESTLARVLPCCCHLRNRCEKIS